MFATSPPADAEHAATASVHAPPLPPLPPLEPLRMPSGPAFPQFVYRFVNKLFRLDRPL